MGWVTASLFVHKLQSQPRQSSLAKAIHEYGKLIKSIYIPKYICREEQQRRVSKQLNKGEALHDLRQWLLFADEGQLKKSQLQEQANQASALTLVTNAIIVWNTVYMQAVHPENLIESHPWRFWNKASIRLIVCSDDVDHTQREMRQFCSSPAR